MVRFLKITFLLPVFFLFVLQSFSQFADLTFQNITRSNGLPVDIVTAIAQDSSGFIWIGSYDGLYRYDGINFKRFGTGGERANTLPNNIIQDLYFSRNDKLWVSTFGGLVLMEPSGKIIKFLARRQTHCFALALTLRMI